MLAGTPRKGHAALRYIFLFNQHKREVSQLMRTLHSVKNLYRFLACNKE